MMPVSENFISYCSPLCSSESSVLHKLHFRNLGGLYLEETNGKIPFYNLILLTNPTFIQIYCVGLGYTVDLSRSLAYFMNGHLESKKYTTLLADNPEFGNPQGEIGLKMGRGNCRFCSIL